MVCVWGGGGVERGRKANFPREVAAQPPFSLSRLGRRQPTTGCCFVPGASATLATEAPSGPLEKFCSWVGRGGMKPTTLEHFSASASPSGCLIPLPAFSFFLLLLAFREPRAFTCP